MSIHSRSHEVTTAGLSMTPHLTKEQWPNSYTKLERFSDTEKKKVLASVMTDFDSTVFTKLKAMQACA